MPKKAPRNAFYFYMLDYKEEQRKKGVNYANMAEVANAAGPVWPTVSPQVRAKYEALAKKEKGNNPMEKKFTSTGISLAEIQRVEQEKRAAEEAELKDIKNFVKLKAFDNRILNEDIYLMDVNVYCKVGGGEYVVGECTILRFNLADGVRDNYHVLINPGRVPIGYGYDAKLGCQEFGLEMPDEGAPRTNYMEILANVIDYLKQNDSNVKTLPPIFTMPEKVAPIVDFIQQMCRIAAEDDSLFRIYKLDTLFFTMANAIKTTSTDGFPRESLALAQLQKDSFKYTSDIGCQMHEQGEKSVECSKSRATRWAFTVLDTCCPLAGVAVVPGHHLPSDFHVPSISSFREQTRERVGSQMGRTSSSAGGSAASSCNTTLNDTQPVAAAAGLSSARKEKRTNPPLRMPTGYVPAPQGPAPLVSDDDFPPLCAGAGRGRRTRNTQH